MRLIGTVNTEQQAAAFCAFLLKEGIKCSAEPFFDASSKKQEARIWVHEEDKLEAAAAFLQEFKEDPSNPKFAQAALMPDPIPVDMIMPSGIEEEEGKDSLAQAKKTAFYQVKPKRFSYPLTYLIILLCSFMYLWNAAEQVELVNQDGVIGLEVGMTPVQEQLMYDFPKTNQAVNQVLKEFDFKPYEKIDQLPAAEQAALKQALSIPSWKGVTALFTDGVSGPLFEKIREGELWRLFTPCLLHGGILHILFNMAWVWILCKQVEVRMNRLKALIMIVLIGVISNTVQYLVSGPYFIGFSGIVVGLVGYIWMRQRIAPWEGYPLQKPTIIFILIFVGAMMGLELLTFVLKFFSINLSANIANTAHIVGGLAGIVLARIPFFSRKVTHES